jgi:hypothetical protein
MDPALAARIRKDPMIRSASAKCRSYPEAIAVYVESLQAHGEAIPPSISEEVVEVNP